jgi:uncharacterized peroxidase-related enzyme
MPRIAPIDPAHANGKAKPLLDGVRQAYGRAPNILRAMAASPAALQAFLGFGTALGGASLGPKLREAIALAVAEANDCGYCVAAHTAAAKALGVDAAERARNREGRSNDAKLEAALRFAVAVVATRGRVTDDDLRRVRVAGHGDGEIVDIVATVAYNIFTNYFDHVAEPELDFPPVETRDSIAA